MSELSDVAAEFLIANFVQRAAEVGTKAALVEYDARLGRIERARRAARHGVKHLNGGSSPRGVYCARGIYNDG